MKQTKRSKKRKYTKPKKYKTMKRKRKQTTYEIYKQEILLYKKH